MICLHSHARVAHGLPVAMPSIASRRTGFCTFVPLFGSRRVAAIAIQSRVICSSGSSSNLALVIALLEIFRSAITMDDPTAESLFGQIYDPNWQQKRCKEGCGGFDFKEAFEKGEGQGDEG